MLANLPYLLKYICNLRMVIHGHAQGCKRADSSNARVSPWGPKPGFASLFWLLGCKQVWSLWHLWCHIFSGLCILLMSPLFQMAPKSRTAVLAGVSENEAVKYLMEKICVLGKLYSGMNRALCHVFINQLCINQSIFAQINTWTYGIDKMCPVSHEPSPAFPLEITMQQPLDWVLTVTW